MPLLKLLFSLDGRIGRLAFLLLFLLSGLMIAPLNWFGQEWLAAAQGFERALLVASLGFALAVDGWCLSAIYTKRLHDFGVSGAFAIPLVGAYLGASLIDADAIAMPLAAVAFVGFLVLLLRRGDTDANAYGPSSGKSGKQAGMPGPLSMAD